MPVQPAPAAVGVSALGDPGAELLDPTKDRGPIHHDPALGQQIADILGRKRKPAVPANGQRDDASREPVALERIAHGRASSTSKPVSMPGNQQSNTPRGYHRRGPWRNFEPAEYAIFEWVDWVNNRHLL